MHIREANVTDVPGLAVVHVDTWRTAYPGIVPAKHLAEMSYERSEARWRNHMASIGDRGFIYVAEEGGQIIGLTSGGPERDGTTGYDGELYGLYVLAEHQHRGIGRALLRAVVQRLVADGAAAMILWVLEDNTQARAFYEAMGGVLAGEKGITIGGAELDEVAYGWPDLGRWLERQAAA